MEKRGRRSLVGRKSCCSYRTKGVSAPVFGALASLAEGVDALRFGFRKVHIEVLERGMRVGILKLACTVLVFVTAGCVTHLHRDGTVAAAKANTVSPAVGTFPR